MEFNLKNIFQEFNPSKFVVYSALLVFSLFLALRTDGTISWSYPVIFSPLWVWKIIAICGAIIGVVIHFRHPPARNDYGSELEYRGMLLCFVENMLLLVFEISACYRMETVSKQMIWLLIIVPLVFVSLISIAVCIWALKREKNFEFELFFAVNILQFIFIALKLDNIIDWSWVIIFIPLWIVICVSLVGVLYAVVLAILLVRSIELLPDHRRQHLFSAIGYTFLVVPVLIFLVLLTKRFDGYSNLPYVMVCMPLYISLLCLIFMACGTRGGNQWWFGIRSDFCVWLLDACPLLQEYGNVSYRFPSVRPNTDDTISHPVETMSVNVPPSTSSTASSGGDSSDELAVTTRPVAVASTSRSGPSTAASIAARRSERRKAELYRQQQQSNCQQQRHIAVHVVSIECPD